MRGTARGDLRGVRRNKHVGACAAAVVLSLLGACTSEPAQGTAEPDAAPSAVGVGDQGASVEAGGTTVILRAGAGAGGTLEIEPAEADPVREQAASDVPGFALGGRPVEVTLQGAMLPADGAKISRRLEQPVPEGQLRALAYFDETEQAWISVPTELSSDRQTLTATVSHFSFWDDASYTLGNVFTGRADAPVCEGEVPEWVLVKAFFEDKNAPVRFCVGRDPKRPDVLVIKGTGSRAYGFTLRPKTQPEWVHSSLTNDAGPVDFLTIGLTGLINPVEAFAKRRTGSMLLAPETRADFGFTEAQIRKINGKPVVVADVDLDYAIAGLIYQVAQDAYGEGNERLAAVFAMVNGIQCGINLTFGGVSGAAPGVLKCMIDQKDTIMQAVIDLSVRYERNRKVKATTKQIKDKALLARKALMAVNAFGFGYQIGEAASDAMLVKESRQVLVSAKPPRPTVPTFSTGEAAIADWVKRNMKGRWRGACPDSMAEEENGSAICAQDIGWTNSHGGGYAYMLVKQGAFHPDVALLVSPLPDKGARSFTIKRTFTYPELGEGDDAPLPWLDSAHSNGKRLDCHLQPAGAVRCGLPPRLDPQCDDDDTLMAVCRFVLAVQTGKLTKLTPDERDVAAQAAELPRRQWTVAGCDMAGDITVLCEIDFGNNTAAGFNLQPRGGEYNAETGGYDVPEGGEVTMEVISFEGMGQPGQFR